MTSGPLIEEVVNVIATARCAGQMTGKEWRMEGEGPVVIECLLVHSSCGPSCSHSIIVESWSLETKDSNQNEGLPSMFLLNAIRSHLHFSQLNAWLSENPLPSNFSVTFRVGSRIQLNKSNSEIHEFPLCRLNRTQLLAVSVEYLRSTAIRLPVGYCISLPLTNDQWLLPSPTETPENSMGPMEMSEINRLKHKLAPSSPTEEEPKMKVPATEETVQAKKLVLPRCDEKSMDHLTSALTTLVARGRHRTKSGSSLSFNRVSASFSRPGTWCPLQATGLPSHSSPTPLSRQRNSYSTSDVADLRRSHGLLGSFEESALKDRLEAVKQLDGYKLQITASGSFCPPHTSIPVKVHVFDENEHDPLPCLGTCSLAGVGRKGYRIPRKGMLQATLFNPQGTVVKVFLVAYDVSDMPSSSHTFLRQRSYLEADRDKHLQHLIHFRLASDRSNRVFLHTDIRILFSQNSSLSGLNIQLKDNVGVDCGKYQLMSEIQTPACPKYSPKK